MPEAISVNQGPATGPWSSATRRMEAAGLLVENLDLQRRRAKVLGAMPVDKARPHCGKSRSPLVSASPRAGPMSSPGITL
jgi:hypothetical protein